MNKDVKRIVDNTKEYERRPKDIPIPVSSFPKIAQLVGKLARVTTTITGGSNGSPGKGKAKLYRFDGTHGTEIDGLDDVDVYSNQGGTVASGAEIVVMRVDGYWFVVVAPCSNT